MNKIAKFIDNERNQPWSIRIVEEGDKYGRDDCLTYESFALAKWGSKKIVSTIQKRNNN